MTSTHTSTEAASPDRVSTGIPGLDTILDGGLIPDRSTLVRGPPGAGKTLFGLHYLTAGINDGETGLFINMGEPERYLRDDATAFGFDTDAIEFLDLTPDKEDFHAQETYDVFATAEVEGPPIAETIAETVNTVEPDRVFIDPMTQLRYLIDDPYRFRKQVMAFLRFLEQTNVVFTSQATQTTHDDDLQFLADAVLELTGNNQRRTVHISKFRGSDYRRGEHTFRITDDGLLVSPTLRPDIHSQDVSTGLLSTGVSELDSLLNGGLKRGTITLLSGPTGVGKTTMGLQFLTECAGEETRAVVYSFEESERTLLDRSDAINIPVREMRERGYLKIAEIEPGRRSVDEFAQRVRRDVEDGETAVVLIDSVDGFQQSLLGVDGVQDLTNLGRYLRNMGVTTLLANEVHRITGEFQVTEDGISQIADGILFMRHIEYQGELRKVVGVLKKRTTDFEHRLRELQITEQGLSAGDPLPELQGILTGTPTWNEGADDAALINANDSDT